MLTLGLKIQEYRVKNGFLQERLAEKMNISRHGKIISPDIFAQFFIDGICMSLMSEANLQDHDYSGSGDQKFALKLRYAKFGLKWLGIY